jgi:hypothetical protein
MVLSIHVHGTGLPYRIEFTASITPTTNLNPSGIYSAATHAITNSFIVQAGYGFATISNVLPSVTVPATNDRGP